MVSIYLKLPFDEAERLHRLVSLSKLGAYWRNVKKIFGLRGAMLGCWGMLKSLKKLNLLKYNLVSIFLKKGFFGR